MKKNLLMVAIASVFMLSGCGFEKESLKTVENIEVIESAVDQEITTDWTEIERSLTGAENSEIAKEFGEWLLDRYENDDWQAMNETTSNRDTEYFKGMVDVVSQLRVAKKNEGYHSAEVIQFTEIMNTTTGKTRGWELLFSLEADSPSDGNEYVESSFYIHTEDGKWVWSLVPLEFDSIQDAYDAEAEASRQEFEAQVQESREEFNQQVQENQERYEQRVQEMNEQYQQDSQAMMERYEQAVQNQNEMYEQRTQEMYEQYQQNVQDMQEQTQEMVDDMYSSGMNNYQQNVQSMQDAFQQNVQEMQEEYQQNVQNMYENLGMAE